MDVGTRSPFLDFFRRGDVAKDIRMMAALGALAPRAHEQLALLVLLTGDADPEVRGTAEATLALIPDGPLAAFLARSDVADGLKEFFRMRGVQPSTGSARETDDPLIDTGPPVESGTGGGRL